LFGFKLHGPTAMRKVLVPGDIVMFAFMVYGSLSFAELRGFGIIGKVAERRIKFAIPLH